MSRGARRRTFHERNQLIAWILLDSIVEDAIPHFDAGRMDQRCPHCNALYWRLETIRRGVFTKCCGEGEVVLPPMTPPNLLMQNLLRPISTDGKEFYKKSRFYNARSAVF